MTIDIFTNRQLSYSQKRAIRNVTSTPAVADLAVKYFDWHDGVDQIVTLESIGDVSPCDITYVIVKDGARVEHYYVLGYTFNSQQCYDLRLYRNAWIGIDRNKKQFIKRSTVFPGSVFEYKAEPKLNFNQIKQDEQLVTDDYGNGPWGILYMNKTDSDLSVALSNLEYNITGTEIPASPDVPTQQPDGSQVAYYTNYTLNSQPTITNTITIPNAQTYEKIDTQSIQSLTQEILSTRYTSKSDTPIIYYSYNSEYQAFIIQRIVLYNVNSNNVLYAKRYDGTYVVNYSTSQEYSPSFTIISGEQISNFQYTGTNHFAVLAEQQGNDALQNGVPILVLKVDDPAYLNPIGMTFSPFEIPTNQPVTQPTINQEYQPGTYLLVDNNNEIKQCSFNSFKSNWSATNNVSVNLTIKSLPESSTFKVINNVSSSILSSVVCQHVNYFVSYQQYIQTGSQIPPYTVKRRIYQSATLNKTTNSLVFNNLTDTITDNAPTGVTFEEFVSTTSNNYNVSAITSATTISTPTLTINTGGFQTGGLQQEFTDLGVTYKYYQDNLSDGYYQVQGKVYQVTPSVQYRGVIQPFNYNVSIPQYQSSNTNQGLYKIKATTTTNTQDVSVTLVQTHLGTPVEVPTTIDYKLDKDSINNNTIVSEPYAILAVPLFTLRYSLNGTTIFNANLNETQKVFYDFIRTYSGTGQVQDAQIIPYAPEIIKQYRKVDQSGQWVDMHQMKTIGSKSDGSSLNSIPFVVLDNSNINFSFYTNVNPYQNKRKEYTCRKLRLCSPNMDSVFDFNYYDFNNEITDWGYSHGNKQLRIDVDITLKPFSLYMHACPFIRDNTLMGMKDFDDFRGIVCGGGIFEQTMTSSQWETYKRQNTMYEQIQQRTVDSLRTAQGVEARNEITSQVIGTIHATQMGGMSGGAIGGAIGAAQGQQVEGGSQAVAYSMQHIENQKLRERELDDQKFYYEANLRNIQAQPDTLNRVSQFNQDILRRFAIVLEVYACTEEEQNLFDQYTEQFGVEINIVDNLATHLIDTCYIEADLIFSDEMPNIHQCLKNDLQKGVYYYEQL